MTTSKQPDQKEINPPIVPLNTNILRNVGTSDKLLQPHNERFCTDNQSQHFPTNFDTSHSKTYMYKNLMLFNKQNNDQLNSNPPCRKNLKKPFFVVFNEQHQFWKIWRKKILIFLIKSYIFISTDVEKP